VKTPSLGGVVWFKSMPEGPNKIGEIVKKLKLNVLFVVYLKMKLNI